MSAANRHNKSRKARRNRNRRRSGERSPAKLNFERLEDRRLLAIAAFVDGFTNTLIIDQTADDGPVFVTRSATGNYTAFDSNNTITSSGQISLEINMGDFETNLTVTNDSPDLVNLDINPGSSDKTVRYEGTGSLTGDLNITGGDGEQHIRITNSIDGNLFVDTGEGDDTFGIEDSSIGGGLTLISTNSALIKSSVVEGAVFVNDPDPTAERDLSISLSVVQQQVSFNGGNSYDRFDVEDSTIHGAVDVNFLGGDTTRTGSSARAIFYDSVLSSGLSIESEGSSVSPETVSMTGTLIGGSVNIQLADGENNLIVTGGQHANGVHFQYYGGSGVDTVNYAPGAGITGAVFSLGDGDDSLTIVGGEYSSLVAFFTSQITLQNDTFVHDLPVDAGFTIWLRNLHGFDFDFENGDLYVLQRVFTSDLRISSGGTEGSRFIRYNVSGVAGGDLFAASQNITVRMRDNSGTGLEFYPDDISGDLDIDLGDGDRTLNFDGEIIVDVGGNTTISGGDGDQTINNFAGDHGGDVSIELGTGNDRLDANYPEIAGRFILKGLNSIDIPSNSEGIPGLEVAGNLVFDSRGDDTEPDILLNSTTVGGNFLFFGSQLKDYLYLEQTAIAGNAYVNLGAGGSTQTFHHVVSMNGSTSIGGDVTILSPANEGWNDSIQLGSGPDDLLAIGGELFINAGGSVNVVLLWADVQGPRLIYRGNGPNALNIVTLAADATNARTNLVLGDKDDSVILHHRTSADDLRIDFGGGLGDSLENNLALTGQKNNFNSRFINYNGYSIFSNGNVDNTHVVQLSDNGNTGVQNYLKMQSGSGGTGVENIWVLSQRIAGDLKFTNFTTTASVSFKMLDNSATKLVVEISTPTEGSLRAQLGDGDREMRIINKVDPGLTSIGTSTRIVGGAGDQSVFLAVDATGFDATYGSTFLTTVSLGEGNDTLDHDGDVNIGGKFILLGVNNYNPQGTLNVGFKMTVDGTSDAIPMNMQLVGNHSVANNLTIRGGSSADEISLGMQVSGSAFIGLGDGNGPTSQRLNLFTSSFGSLTVTAGDAAVRNDLTIGDEVIVENGLAVNFNNNSTNRIEAYGAVLSGAVTIRGGSGEDEVIFGIIAPDADAKILTFDGEDNVTLKSNTDVNNLTINFGEGVDEFFSEFGGDEPFDLTLINL